MSKSYVVESAKLQCSYGSQASSLKVPVNHRATINDQRQANIKDHKPNRNIQSFGLCSSLANPEVAAATAANHGHLKKLPCKPATLTPWVGGKPDFLLANEPVLLGTSSLRCCWAGTITITDCGQ